MVAIYIYGQVKVVPVSGMSKTVLALEIKI